MFSLCWTVIICLYCIVPRSLSVVKWQVNFYQNEPSDTPNILHISFGHFTSFFAVISPEPSYSSAPEYNFTRLSLSDPSGIFTTPQPYYRIDSRDSFTFPLEIGATCRSDAELPSEAVITFVSVSPEFSISNITVHINASIIHTLPIRNYSSTVPLNGYGLIYFVSKEIRNVDDIVVSFIADDATADKAAIDVAVIPPYSDAVSYKIYFAKYYGLAGEGGNAFGFSVVYGNRCFKGEQRVSFTVTNELVVPDRNLLASSIRNTARTVSTGQPSKIRISVSINVSPIVVYCALRDTGNPFLTEEDIVSQRFPENPLNLRYFFGLFASRSTHFIEFDNVSKYIPYKLKCVFTPALTDSNYNNTNTTLTFGYLPVTDVLLTIDSTDVEPTPAHCMTWMLDNVSDVLRRDFILKALHYCTAELIHPWLPRSANGCFKCVRREVDSTVYPTQHEQQAFVSICAASQDNCTSHYQGDFALKFKEISDSINSTENIYAEFGSNVTVSGFYLEDDEVVPNEEDIYITDFRLSNSEVTFKAFTNESKKVECKAAVKQRSASLLSPYAFNESIVLNNAQANDNGNTTIQHVVHFDNGDYDDRLYNLVFQCYNIPMYSYSFKKTKVFVVAQFIRGENQLPLTNKTFPVHCDDSTKFNEQCVETTYHSLSSLEAPLPIKDHTSEYKEYRNKEINERYAYIDSKLSEIRDDALNISAKFETIVFISDLLMSLQCKTYIDFAECRRFKKDTMRVIVDEMDKHIGYGDCIERISHSDSETQIANAKLVLLGLFHVCNNADAFDYANTTITVIKIFHNVYEHFAQLLQLFNHEHKVARDLIKIFVGALDNVVDVLAFSEVDGNFRGHYEKTGLSRINVDTHFIRDIHCAILTELIANCSSYIHLYNAMPSGLTHFNYSVHELDSTAERDEQYQSVTVGDAVISLPVNHLLNRNAKYLAIVRYTDYPLVSYEHRSTAENVPVLSLKVLNGEKEIIPIKNLPEPKKIFIVFNGLPDEVQFCYHFSYDPEKGDKDISHLDFDHKGVVTDQTELRNRTVTCQLSHLSTFTVGKHDIKGKIYTSGMNSWVIGLVVVLVVCACANTLALVFKAVQEVKNKDIECIMDEQFEKDAHIINQSTDNDD